MSTVPRPMVTEPQPAAFTGWLRRAREVLAASAPAIDAINVFPAPDADTGTNVTLTLTGVLEAAGRTGTHRTSPGWSGLGRAAVVSAHGNSGAVIGQMIAIAVDRLTGPAATEPCGRWLASTLRAAADAATAAIAKPVRGTVLTVAEAAADAAEPAARHSPTDGLGVARVARASAAIALRRTTEQLAPLRAAGVVDAGGQAYLLLLDVLVEVLGGEPAEALPDPPTGEADPAHRAAEESTGLFEVMYLLTGAGPEVLDRLRHQLSDSADSVVVVTDGTPRAPETQGAATAQVHAHLARPELAIAPGLGAGTVTGLRVTPLSAEAIDPSSQQRAPLVIIDDPAQAGLLRAHGGVPIMVGPDDHDQHDGIALLAATLARSDQPMIIVAGPGTEPAIRKAIATCTPERRVELVPVDGSVQALCALAVHEPTAGVETTAATMREAAVRVRTGTAKRAEDCWQLIMDLDVADAELITIIAGTGGAGTAADLARRVKAHSPDIEIELLAGGQTGPELLIGVET